MSSASKKLNVLITGGSKGIGLACADRFRSGGHNVVCAYRNSPLKHKDDVPWDLSNLDILEEFYNQIVQKFDSKVIDVLVNSVGYCRAPLPPGSGFAAMRARAEEMIALNQLSVTLLTDLHLEQTAVKWIPTRVVSVISRAAFQPSKADFDYGAAKAAVRNHMMNQAKRFLDNGDNAVGIYTVSPGWVSTDMLDQMAEELKTSARVLVNSIPLGRATLPEEVATMVYLCATEIPNVMSGTDFPMTGGSLFK